MQLTMIRCADFKVNPEILVNIFLKNWYRTTNINDVNDYLVDSNIKINTTDEKEPTKTLSFAKHKELSNESAQAETI